MYLVISICERSVEVLGKTSDFDLARTIMAEDMLKFIGENHTVEEVLSGKLDESYTFECGQDNGWYNGKEDFDWQIINLDEVEEKTK